MTSNANKWGSEHFRLSGLNMKPATGSPLEQAVKLLPARVKQAFYGAAMRKGVIARSTWNGCAFNAGSLEQEVLGDKVSKAGVTSGPAAAQVFGISEFLVSNFIQAWDSSPYPSDQAATEALVEILERIGIYSDPDQPKVRIVMQTVCEGTDAELMAAFKKELENPEFSFPELAAAEELFANV